MVFFLKQKTAYEVRISDWSSDVCSSDLLGEAHRGKDLEVEIGDHVLAAELGEGAPVGAAGIVHQDVDGAEFRQRRRHRLLQGRLVGDIARKDGRAELGRASCRERVCQSGWISVGAESLKKKAKRC